MLLDLQYLGFQTDTRTHPPYLRWWCYRKWSRAYAQPEVTGSHGSMFCACPAFSPSFFSYYSSSTKGSMVVVQVPGLPEVTKGHVTPERNSLGVRMCNRKLCNIRPSVVFWPEVTLLNVTRRGFPWVRVCISAIRGTVYRECALIVSWCVTYYW